MATLKDVAAQAGVSLSTVSIVAKGQAQERKISAATQDKVHAAMVALGYIPNAAARRLRGGNTRKTIVLFWADDFREAMLARFLKGLHALVDKLEADLDISVVIYKTGSLSIVSALQGAPDFNGAIIANANSDDLAYLAKNKPLVPTVLYNRNLNGYASVTVNDCEIGHVGATKVIEFIQAQKATDEACAAAWNNQAAGPVIAYLSAPYAFAGMQEREQSFVEELELAGISTASIKLEANSAEAGHAAAKALFEQHIRVVFAPSDAIALGLLNACYEQGISVPGQLGVVAVGNGLPEYAEHACPPLTCVEIPMEAMAEKCLETLLAQLEDANIATSGQQYVLPPQLIERASL